MRIDSQKVTIVTTTLYPNWYPGEISGSVCAEKVRGDLAINMLKEAKIGKYQIVVVDGGSSEFFLKEVSSLEISIYPQKEKSMSGSRRQAISIASQLIDTQIICWVEPEKVSVINGCLPKALLPIMNNEVDYIILARDEKSFKTYPDYQVKYEKRANRLFTGILKEKKIIPQDLAILDVWFGPRIFRNKKEIIDLYLSQYLKYKEKDHDPELWFNTQILPVIKAFQKGIRVKQMTVPYRHSQTQTKVELTDSQFIKKRLNQFNNLIANTKHYLSDTI